LGLGENRMGCVPYVSVLYFYCNFINKFFEIYTPTLFLNDSMQMLKNYFVLSRLFATQSQIKLEYCIDMRTLQIV